YRSGFALTGDLAATRTEWPSRPSTSSPGATLPMGVYPVGVGRIVESATAFPAPADPTAAPTGSPSWSADFVAELTASCWSWTAKPTLLPRASPTVDSDGRPE